MSSIWITSDLHLGHSNIIKYCPKTRGQYRDGQHMNESMIAEWNSHVDENDTVYILGDVGFMTTEKLIETVNRLQGKKILIEGNHDRKALKNEAYRACFAEIHQYLTIGFEGTKVVMFHYPILDHEECARGSVHFHGHRHGDSSGLEKYRVRDVGVDATGKVVTLMRDMIVDAMKGSIKSHHEGESLRDKQ